MVSGSWKRARVESNQYLEFLELLVIGWSRHKTELGTRRFDFQRGKNPQQRRLLEQRVIESRKITGCDHAKHDRTTRTNNFA